MEYLQGLHKIKLYNLNYVLLSGNLLYKYMKLIQNFDF